MRCVPVSKIVATKKFNATKYELESNIARLLPGTTRATVLGTTSNVDGEVSEHDAELEKLGKKQFDMDTMHVFERKCFTMATDALKKVIEF